MPLFGSKKDKSKSKGEKSAYPTQAAAYPAQQPAYPAQQPAYAVQQPAYAAQQPAYSAQQPAPGEQPPPYMPAGAAPPPGAYGAPYPGQHPGYANYPMQPNYGYPQPGAAGMVPQFPPGTHVIGQGTYDAGARFNSGASVNVPPPPPGCAPNAAQVASMHGGTVHMNQGRAGFFSTSSDGGVTTHID